MFIARTCLSVRRKRWSSNDALSSGVLLSCVGGVLELLRELQPDRDADEHPEPGLLGDERADGAHALVGIVLQRGVCDLALVGRAEPAALGQRRGEQLLQPRRGVRDDLLGVAEATRVAERPDGRVDLLRGVPAGGHATHPSTRKRPAGRTAGHVNHPATTASAAEDLDRDVRDLGRRAADPHALGLERLRLARRGAGAAGHDRAGVAHGLARRRGEAGDVADDGLLDVRRDVLGGLLLGRPTDLAAHHDELGLLVVLEELDDVDEARARHRVAADADDARVAEPALGELVADLVGQRAGARHDADVALLEEVGRDDADVRLARRQNAGAVGADQPNAVLALQVRVDAQLVMRGDALGDADDRLDPRIGGLEHRIGGEARRHEHHRGVRPGLLDRLVERVEHGDALDVLAALARRHARHDVRAVALVFHRVERALAARDARDAHARLLVDQDAHALTSAPDFASSTTRWAASSIVASTCSPGRSASAKSRRPSSSFVPSRRTTNGTCGLTCSNASISPLATSSQRVMPPKMLNSTALTFGSDRITSTADTIASAFDPPPASRKFAGAPPCCATTSNVDITSPAPLPRIPMLPSSFT